MKRLPAAGVWMAAALLAASALFAGRLVGAQETVDIGRGAAPAIPATSATRPQTRPALASTPAHEPQATSDTERKAQMERERYRHELDQVRHEMAQREAENHRLQAEKVQHETAIRALQARVNELSRKRAAPAAGARRGSEELAVETARAQARQMASLSEQLDQRERQLTEMQLLYTESSPKVRESQAMRDTLKKRIDVLTAQAAERDLAVRTAQAKADQAQRAREETLAHRNALTAEQARERMHADAARRSQEDVAALRQQINELRREVEKLRQKQASSPSTGK